jgi:hypothetical protein
MKEQSNYIYPNSIEELVEGKTYEVNSSSHRIAIFNISEKPTIKYITELEEHWEPYTYKKGDNNILNFNIGFDLNMFLKNKQVRYEQREES